MYLQCHHKSPGQYIRNKILINSVLNKIKKTIILWTSWNNKKKVFQHLREDASCSPSSMLLTSIFDSDIAKQSEENYVNSHIHEKSQTKSTEFDATHKAPRPERNKPKISLCKNNLIF